MQLIGQKKIAIVILDLSKDDFIIYMAYLSAKMLIHLAWKTWKVLLLIKKIIILIKYLNFAKIFLKKLVAKLSKHFDINMHLINLEFDK